MKLKEDSREPKFTAMKIEAGREKDANKEMKRKERIHQKRDLKSSKKKILPKVKDRKHLKL